MTSRLVLTKKDPRRTDFVLLDDALHNHHATPAAAVAAGQSVYTSDTTHYARPRNGACATTLVTRTATDGDRLQVGIIEWPAHPLDPARLVIGTRDVHMVKTGIFTSSERFTATDGCVYEWQIQDGRPQLVPVRPSHNRTFSTSYVATFVQSQSGFSFWRKRTASLFIPPEGYHILDDIVVTFIYFESRWRDKESVRSRSSFSGGLI